MKFAGNDQRKRSFFSKLQVYENIHKKFFFSVTLKADFGIMFSFKFSLWRSSVLLLLVLLPVTLQKELSQVSFLGISRTNTVQRCIQTKYSLSLNLLTIFSESSILDV